jgi:hypothetical protein
MLLLFFSFLELFVFSTDMLGIVESIVESILLPGVLSITMFSFEVESCFEIASESFISKRSRILYSEPVETSSSLEACDSDEKSSSEESTG